MSVAGLSPPGGSSYTSPTMTVGDGTWDSTRNDFLLPNLQGLNFATMQYNGMGNRFRDEPQYRTLIIGHGVLAAITFLGIVPLAVFLAKYGKDWPGARVSFKLHVYCQILVVFLTTVILVLGWFAVGPERSLTNPHHGIGVAIYTLILFQFIYGTLMYRRERRRSAFPTKLPLSVWIHKLLGRSIAMLAIVQIALGLTLYGSPKSLFILYALAGAFLLFWYLALDYYNKPRVGAMPPGADYSDYGSYVSGSRTDMTPAPRRRNETHWGRDLLAAGGIFGAYELWKSRRERRRSERLDRIDGAANYPPTAGPPRPSGPPVGRPPPPGMGPPPIGAAAAVGGPRPGGRPPTQSMMSGESWEDEKYNRSRHTWRDRFLETAGLVGAYEGVKTFANRRRRQNDEYHDNQRYGSGRYRPPLGGNQNMVSGTDVSRVEAGEAPLSPDTPRINMGGAQPMTPSMTPSRPPRRPTFQQTDVSYDSREDYEAGPNRPPNDDGPHTLRDSIAAFGAIAGLREWNRRRRERREFQRSEDMRKQELNNEDVFQRRHENTYPRPQDANTGDREDDSTLMTGPTGTVSGPTPTGLDTRHPPLPANAGAVPGTNNTGGIRPDIAAEQGYSLPPPPAGRPPQNASGYERPVAGSAFMPEGAVQPDPNRLVTDSRYTDANTAANEGSAFGRDHGGHIGRNTAETAGAAGVGALAGAALMSGARRTDSDLNSPSRLASRQESHSRLPAGRSGSRVPSSASQLNNDSAAIPPSSGPNSSDPRISLKVHPHQDGQHVTLRRLNEQEAAAERQARIQDRRSRQRRRNSSLSSGGGGGGGGGNDDGPPPANQRYRRTGPPMRPSIDQPITNIPPPPPMMSNSALGSSRRPSELNLPPAAATIPAPQAPLPRPPEHSVSPHTHQFSSPSPGLMPQQQQQQQFQGSGIGSPGAYATDTATGTDVSTFADNRRRRRAERARRLEAARGNGGATGASGHVEFQ